MITTLSNIVVASTGTQGFGVGNAPYDPLFVAQVGTSAVSGSQLSGSTFNGSPLVAGGVWFASGGGPAYVRSLQTDVSGVLFVSSSTPLSVWNAVTVGVSGSQLTGSTFNGVPVVMGGAYGLGTFGAAQTNFGVRALNVDISGSAIVKEAKDIGRTYVSFTTSSVSGTLGETLISLQAVRGFNASGAVGTSFQAASSGKTFRLQQMILTWNSVTAVTGSVLCRLRVHPSASVTAKSLSIGSLGVGVVGNGGNAAGIGFSYTTMLDFPDGVEFSGNHCIGVTQQANTTTAGFDVSLIGYEYSN